MKRFFSAILVIVLLSNCFVALAADVWKCPSCGQTGNMGNFCPACGAAKPTVKPQATWTCSYCFQDGNTGAYCVKCGKAKQTTRTVKVGDYITFGKYEQDNQNANGAEPIEWTVLEIKNGKALVISRYVIIAAQFQKHSNKQSWYNCTLRDYLNDTFYKSAFTSSEKKAIQSTYVEDNMSHWDPAHYPHDGRKTQNTTDYIFILSYGEIIRYMPTEKERVGRTTKYCEAQGANCRAGCSWYWLRNPAYNNNAGAVDWDGTIATCYMNHAYGAVRPACWVDLSAIGYSTN